MSQADNKNNYAKLVKMAALLASTTAFVLVIIKLYAWLITDASAMLASATDSLLDLFASLMSVIILRFALAPADDEHKFGHGKAESLAGLVQSAFVLGSAVLLVVNGIQRILHPVFIERTEVGVIVTFIALFFTLALVVVQKQVIKKTGSVAISADALHYQSDILLNVGVLIALLLSNKIWLQADGVFTVLVGVYLVYGAVKISWLSIKDLMDSELPEEDINIVQQIVAAHDEALGLHDLRTRQSGNQKFIQFHLELANDISLLKAHRIGDSIEQQIIAKLAPCEVFIHHDPNSVVTRAVAENKK